MDDVDNDSGGGDGCCSGEGNLSITVVDRLGCAWALLLRPLRTRSTVHS